MCWNHDCCTIFKLLFVRLCLIHVLLLIHLELLQGYTVVSVHPGVLQELCVYFSEYVFMFVSSDVNAFICFAYLVYWEFHGSVISYFFFILFILLFLFFIFYMLLCFRIWYVFYFLVGSEYGLDCVFPYNSAKLISSARNV